MKRLMYGVALGVLTVRANSEAQVTNGMVHWQVPSNSLAAARSSVKPLEIFKMTDNTPAFEEFAVNAMLAVANDMRVKWKLEGLDKPLTIDDIQFLVQATPYGIWGGIETRDNRYCWGFDRNSLSDFSDNKYRSRFFRYHNDEEARLAQIKSKITGKEALAIATTAIEQLGKTSKQLGLRDPEVNQYKFEESNGVVYPLPCFNVAWGLKGEPDYDEGSNVKNRPITMDISGITKNVAEYFNPDFRTRAPRLPVPTNYWAMLNLPTNYLDTLPPVRRVRLGLPRLTNAPVDTNVIR